MSKTQRTVTLILWGLLVLMLAAVIGAGVLDRLRQDRLEVLFPAATFSLTDQDNRPLADKDLRGRVWVADFIFTTCGDICPRMTAKMSQLHKAVLNKDVRFVSFSVNPQFDTPTVLKDYAKQYGADARWHLLTGGSEAIHRIAVDMKVAVQSATQQSPILHSEKFFLVDGRGQVRQIYTPEDPEQFKKLVVDIEALQKETGGVLK